MKYISLKILILCLLIPPVCYILSMSYLEGYFHQKYQKALEKVYLSDFDSIFGGRVRIQDAIEHNIQAFLKNDFFSSAGLKISPMVSTKRGQIIYPSVLTDTTETSVTSNPIATATANYEIMNDGLNIKVAVKLAHNTVLSNAILLFYLLVSGFLIYLHYRSGVLKVRRDEMETGLQIDALLDKEKRYSRQLSDLENERRQFHSNLSALKERLVKQQVEASQNEEGFIEEIVSLEKKIEENIFHQGQQQASIEALHEKIRNLEKKDRKGGSRREKESEFTRKRFSTIYKETVFDDRAIDGYLNLSDDLKLKCEEIIQILSHDAGKVPIKRKVFGKKNSETTLEVVFGYKGRLYFRKLRDNKNEVLTIGTKNTQQRDLEFLKRL